MGHLEEGPKVGKRRAWDVSGAGK